MSVALRLFSFPILIIMLCLLPGCGSDPELSKEQKVEKMLLGTWIPASTGMAITLDGEDVQDDLFRNFTITFIKEQFITTGTSPVWLREDTWWFKSGTDGMRIIRGMDQEEIVIERITESELIFSLDWNEITTEGRTGSFPGVYTFKLTSSQ